MRGLCPPGTVRIPLQPRARAHVDREDYSAHSLTLSTTPEELKEIGALSRQYGLPVVSISSSLYGGRMGSPDKEERWFSDDGFSIQHPSRKRHAAIAPVYGENACILSLACKAGIHWI